MTATRNCPACGNPLPADAPAGLCPRCLLAGAFATAASPPNADFEPPAVAELAPLFPQLEIIELLGVGGMGAVYKARQPGLDRLVALKVLPPRDDPAFAERFTREARTLAKLNHPGIVQVYDFGQAGGHSYIVMEYVEGVNLRQAERAGTMTPAEALVVVPQICAALQFAHEAGVVHRDIKPENVLLDAKGRVKIADFGLAKLLGAAGPQHLTGTHQAMGTMHYMAPEQWEKPATVDHRADIYSLGVVFYELLTGELPLGRFAPPSEKVRVDVRLDSVVLRALEKEPERRYQHASDVKTDVETITAKPSPIDRPGIEPPPRRWTTSSVMALLVILLSVVAYPVGIVALPVVWWVSHKRKQSMVRVVDDAMHFLGLHQAATWMTIACFAGVANAFLPWVAVENHLMKKFFFGFDPRFADYPVMITSGFLVLGILFFVTAQLPRLRPWRAGIALIGGATLIVLAVAFVHAANATRGWNLSLAAAFGSKTTPEFTVWVGPGPFVAAGLAMGLMGLGAIDLRGYLVDRPNPPTPASDSIGNASQEQPHQPPPLPGAPSVARHRPLRHVLFSINTWTVALCVVAAASTLLPWVRLSGLPFLGSGLSFYLSGFELRELHLGKVIAGLFLATAAVPLTVARIWRPHFTITGAVLVLIAWGYFFAAHDDHPPATTRVTVGEKTTETVQATSATLLPAAYVPPVLALLLLACAVIDLGGRTGGGSAAVAAAVPPSPPPAPQTGFFRHVGLPVLALVGLGLVAYWVVRSDLSRPTRETAEVAPNGVAFLGLVVAVMLLIRWLRMTRRPQSSTTSWGTVALIVLVPVLALCFVGYLMFQRSAGGGKSQVVQEQHDLLLGGWKTLSGKVVVTDNLGVETQSWGEGSATITFKADGTFETQQREGVTKGPYDWIDNDSIRLRLPGATKPGTYWVAIDKSELTLTEDEERGGKTIHTERKYTRVGSRPPPDQ